MKIISKNRILSLLVLVLFFNFSSISVAKEKFQNFYWSTNNSGPITIKDAIDLFFQNKKLNVIEGIWEQDHLGTIAIIRSKEIHGFVYAYKKYIISHNYDRSLDGSISGTLYRTKHKDLFILFERSGLVLDIEKNDNYKTATGTVRYTEDGTKANILIKGTEDLKNINKKILLNKLYPKN